MFYILKAISQIIHLKKLKRSYIENYALDQFYCSIFVFWVPKTEYELFLNEN